MPKRPDVSARLESEAKGRSVFSDTATPPAAPTPGRKGAGPKWEDAHRRATFHLPVVLIEAVDAESKRSGRSKASIVGDAIRQHLGVDDEESRRRDS